MFDAHPSAVAAGLVTAPRHQGSEPELTEIGLLAIAGALAFDEGEDSRIHNLNGVRKVLDTARNSGIPESVTDGLLSSFAAGHSAIDDEAMNHALHTVCRYCGTGRVAAILSGAFLH